MASLAQAAGGNSRCYRRQLALTGTPSAVLCLVPWYPCSGCVSPGTRDTDGSRSLCSQLPSVCRDLGTGDDSDKDPALGLAQMPTSQQNAQLRTWGSCSWQAGSQLPATGRPQWLRWERSQWAHWHGSPAGLHLGCHPSMAIAAPAPGCPLCAPLLLALKQAYGS